MQIKTSRKYHFTPLRIAVIGKKENDKCWGRLDSYTLLVGKRCRIQSGRSAPG